MISTLLCAEEKQEKAQIYAGVRKLAAKLTEDEWSIHAYDALPELERYLENHPLVDLACCNVVKDDALEWLKRFRREYRETRVMLVASERMSPTRYLCPQIMASALLLKPYSQEQLLEVLEEFLRAWLEEQPDQTKSFVISKREGKLVIPYDNIYYLEAREKKVFLRLSREEHAVYDTLENISRSLPDYFVRTHRSFVINSRKLEKLCLSDHLVQLQDGFSVPLSRGCSAGLKEFLT